MKNREEPEESTINLSEVPALQMLPIPQTLTAHLIASRLLKIFEHVLLVVIGLAFALLIVDRFYCGTTPTNFVKDSLLPLISGIATFSATVFGPLLAFVLGHYFGQKTPR